MHRRRSHDQHMENLMRAAPNIELSPSHGFRNSRPVEERSDDQEQAFEEIIRHSTLLIHLWDTKDFDTVDERREAGQAGEDKGTDAESSVAKALELSVEEDDDCG
ncbi:MAG: hypothetical protein Q9170_008305 [Blastenia crenularia]